MKLKKLSIYDGGTLTPGFDDAAALVGALGLPGGKPEAFRLAAWNGHNFEVVSATSRSGSSFVLDHRGGAHEIAMVIYYPLDPRITEADVAGAVRAYPNADGSGWLFAHTDEGTHHDYELVLLAACDGVFQPLFRQYQVDMLKPATRTPAEERFKLLSEFYGQAVIKLRDLARSRFLGEREQQAHPKEGWLDRDITSAVAAAKAKWKESRPTDFATISSAVRYLEQALAMPAVETRWDRDARIAAEQKAKDEDE